MYVVRLHINSQHFHAMLARNRMEQIFQRRLDWLLEYVSTIHWTPHHMIGCAVDTTSCMYSFIHVRMVAQNGCVCNATAVSSPE